VVGTDHNGCKNSDKITVRVVPIPVMDFSGDNLYGCQALTTNFTNLSTGNLTACKWTFSNGDIINDCGTVTSVFPDAGCYDATLWVSTPEGCTNTLTLKDYICVEPNPVADFSFYPTVLSTYDWESQMENLSSGAVNYVWNFGDASSSVADKSPLHAFPNQEEGSYIISLIAISSAGCVDTAYGRIELLEELLFYVPNAFTPNGNTINDDFKPVFSTGYHPNTYTLYIFDRWGDIIFESHDTSIGWDGTYGKNHELSQEGVYSWKIEVKHRKDSKRIEQAGHVTLLR